MWNQGFKANYRWQERLENLIEELEKHRLEERHCDEEEEKGDTVVQWNFNKGESFRVGGKL